MVVPFLRDDGPWTHQTTAVAGGEEHGDQHTAEDHEVHHRDGDLDEILQNLTDSIQSDPPSDEAP